MHEATIAASLLGIVERSAADAGASEIIRIEVALGRLKAVEPDLLESCFEFMAEGTVCQGAELAIRHIPIIARCRNCGCLSEISAFRFRCGYCEGRDLEVVSGRELKVDRILAALRRR